MSLYWENGQKQRKFRYFDNRNSIVLVLPLRKWVKTIAYESKSFFFMNGFIIMKRDK